MENSIKGRDWKKQQKLERVRAFHKEEMMWLKPQNNTSSTSLHLRISWKIH